MPEMRVLAPGEMRRYIPPKSAPPAYVRRASSTTRQRRTPTIVHAQSGNLQLLPRRAGAASAASYSRDVRARTCTPADYLRSLSAPLARQRSPERRPVVYRHIKSASIRPNHRPAYDITAGTIRTVPLIKSPRISVESSPSYGTSLRRAEIMSVKRPRDSFYRIEASDSVTEGETSDEEYEEGQLHSCELVDYGHNKVRTVGARRKKSYAKARGIVMPSFYPRSSSPRRHNVRVKPASTLESVYVPTARMAETPSEYMSRLNVPNPSLVSGSRSSSALMSCREGPLMNYLVDKYGGENVSRTPSTVAVYETDGSARTPELARDSRAATYVRALNMHLLAIEKRITDRVAEAKAPSPIPSGAATLQSDPDLAGLSDVSSAPGSRPDSPVDAIDEDDAMTVAPVDDEILRLETPAPVDFELTPDSDTCSSSVSPRDYDPLPGEAGSRAGALSAASQGASSCQALDRILSGNALNECGTDGENRTMFKQVDYSSFQHTKFQRANTPTFKSNTKKPFDRVRSAKFRNVKIADGF